MVPPTGGGHCRAGGSCPDLSPALVRAVVSIYLEIPIYLLNKAFPPHDGVNYTTGLGGVKRGK